MKNRIISLILAVTVICSMASLLFSAQIYSVAESTLQITPTESFKLWEYVPDEGVHFGHTNAAVTLSVAYDDRAGGNGSYVYGNPAAGMNFALNVRPSDSSKYVADENFNLWRTNANLFSKMNLAVNGIIYNRTYKDDNLKLQLVNEGLGYNTTHSTGDNTNGVTNQLKFKTPSNYYTVDETLIGNENATWDTPTMVLWFASTNFAASREAGTFTITTDSNVIVNQCDAVPFTITTPYAQNVSGSTYALPGDEVTLSTTVELSDFRIISGSNDVPYIDNGDGTFTFTMPEGIVDFKALPATPEVIQITPTENFVLWQSTPGVSATPIFNAGTTGTNHYVMNDSGVTAHNFATAINENTPFYVNFPANKEYNTLAWTENETLRQNISAVVNVSARSDKGKLGYRVSLANSNTEAASIDTGIIVEGYGDQHDIYTTEPLSLLTAWDGTYLNYKTNYQSFWAKEINIKISDISITTTKNVIVDRNGVDSTFTITTPYNVDAIGNAFALAGDSVTIKSESSVLDLKIICGQSNVDYTDNGDNSFTFTMPDGIVDFKAELAVSTDSTLSGIGLSDGDLFPAFLPDFYEYSVTVPYECEKITVTPTVTSSRATILEGDGEHSLNVGENLITIKVKAESGIEKTYTLTVMRSVKTLDKTEEVVLMEYDFDRSPPVYSMGQDRGYVHNITRGVDDEGKPAFVFNFDDENRIYFYDNIFPVKETKLNNTWSTNLKLISRFAENATLRFKAKLNKVYSGDAADCQADFIELYLSDYANEVLGADTLYSQVGRVTLTDEWAVYEIPMSTFQQSKQWFDGIIKLNRYGFAGGDEVYISQMQIVANSCVIKDVSEDTNGSLLFETDYNMDVSDVAYSLPGKEVIITAQPSMDYALKDLKVMAGGEPVVLTQDGNKYKFVMPDAVVTASATWKSAPNQDDLDNNNNNDNNNNSSNSGNSGNNTPSNGGSSNQGGSSNGNNNSIPSYDNDNTSTDTPIGEQTVVKKYPVKSQYDKILLDVQKKILTVPYGARVADCLKAFVIAEGASVEFHDVNGLITDENTVLDRNMVLGIFFEDGKVDQYEIKVVGAKAIKADDNAINLPQIFMYAGIGLGVLLLGGVGGFFMGASKRRRT